MMYMWIDNVGLASVISGENLVFKLPLCFFNCLAQSNRGERAPPLNLTQIDNLLRNCVNEIFVIVARQNNYTFSTGSLDI